MGTMLPAASTSSRSLADVLASCVAAVDRRTNPLGLRAVDRAIVVLSDGLGALNLRARAGHARFLAQRLNKSTTIDSGFLSTTAVALASLCTGTAPGVHGITGYRAFDPERDRVFNHLSGWKGEPDPESWQRAKTLFEQTELKSYAIGPERYRGSSFSRAILRGAEYVGAKTLEERFAAARRVFDEGGRSIVYLYVPELDVIAHAKGWESDAWLAELEKIDSAIARFAGTLKASEGMLVTADHGALDVPASSQVVFDENPALIDGVRHVGGDPRCLQLYVEPGADVATLVEAWREAEGHRSWIATRAEAIQAGWFGAAVDEAVLPRIGDILVAARSKIAYYDSRTADASSRAMVGQHGSFAPEETKVPLIGLGAFER